MKKPESIADLFELTLRYAYDCEQQLIKALPKMAQASTSTELRRAFEQHLDETRTHALRLEEIFTSLKKKAEAEKNPVIRELIDAGDKMIGDIDRSPLLDAALIVAGNEVEHYEMAVYGSLRNWAHLLGNYEAGRLLEQTLMEEKAADQKLTDIGESSVNRDALNVHAHA
ncbi:MAG TPA: ferritin-like domain-containing protein [Bryobacteraceae bacterium]|nr:ferritin-like domain-containing protein [Bryobacteraceae bacterium]